MAGYLVITSSKPPMYASPDSMSSAMARPSLSSVMPPTSAAMMANMMPSTSTAMMANMMPPTSTPIMANMMPSTSAAMMANMMPPTSTPIMADMMPPTRTPIMADIMPPRSATIMANMTPPTSTAIMANMLPAMTLTPVMTSTTNKLTAVVSPVRVVVTEECCFSDQHQGQQVTGWAEMRLEMIEDEFDKYFARAAQVKEVEMPPIPIVDIESDLRRGSLPSSRLKTPELSSTVRRTASCKYPSRRERQRDRSCSPRTTSVSPKQRPSSINLEASGLTNDSYIHENTLRAPSPGPAIKCHSAPHSRSSSMKKGKRPRGGSNDDVTPEARPRTGSVPLEETVVAQLERIKFLQTEDFCPVRNFSTSSKGLINRGDSFKRKSSCSIPADCKTATTNNLNAPKGRRARAVSVNSGTSKGAAERPSFKVVILGDHGVGKTALLQQFLTSEYMGAATESENIFDDDNETTVSVLIDGEETTMDFIDVAYEENFRNYGEVDAYVVVFSLTDRDTFQRAEEILHDVSRHAGGQAASIMVANKSELARCRQVTEEEAREICTECNSKYIELSAALNHKVDELLVGIARQIRLNPKRQARARKHRDGRGREGSIVAKSAKGLMEKIFRNKQVVSKSCDNLHVL